MWINCMYVYLFLSALKNTNAFSRFSNESLLRRIPKYYFGRIDMWVNDTWSKQVE